MANKSLMRRVLGRTRRHLARTGAALIASGPGRLAGEIVSVQVRPDDVILRGWAALPLQRVRAVVILADGFPVAQAQVNAPTPRAADGLPVTERSSDAGWRAVIPRSELSAGRNRLAAAVLLQHGLWEGFDEAIVHLASPLEFGSMDHPYPGVVVREKTMIVRGWFRLGQGYDSVVIRLNGQVAARARLMSTPRHDVELVLDDKDAPLAGWDALIDLSELLPGNVEISATAVGADDSWTIAECLFRYTPESRPVRDPDRHLVLRARTDAVLQANPGSHGKRPRILVATHQLGLGGGQLYLHELLRLLVDRSEFDFTVISSQDGALREELEAWGVPTHILGLAPFESLSYEQWMQSVAAVAARSGADAILANTAGVYWGVDLAQRMGKPSIWAVHESFTPEVYMRVGLGGTPDEGVADAFRAAFASADAVIFEADATKDLFAEILGPDNGVRVDYGIDLDRIRVRRRLENRSEDREKFGFTPSEVVILCMGVFEARKAQGLLAYAFGRISSDFPNAVLALVGDIDSHYSEGVHRVVQRLDLGDRIRIIPVTPDIDAWYSAADAFMLASDVESLPRSMMEAMAFGLPVIAPRVFGIPEMIDDGDTGLLFDPTSLAEIEATLRRFLTLSTTRRLDIGTRGKELVERTRSSAHYGNEVAQLINRLIKDPGARTSSIVDTSHVPSSAAEA